MPSVTWNQKTWNREYPWGEAGEEWSKRWGGSLSQWRTCVWPRIASFLPADSLVEIAPGYGRWTQYLLPHCKSYTGVDLSEQCIYACRERFAGTDAVFVAGDGMSLPTVQDESVDLVFSFDSLVHCEDDVIAAYLRECARVLGADGVAFIHHSNLGRYRRSSDARDKFSGIAHFFPSRREALRRIGVARWDDSRGRSMTATRFAQLTTDAALACIGQEVIGWVSPLLIDCISVVARPGSRWDRPNVVVRNRNFHVAARSAAAAAHAFPQGR
jgi:ubiquinone/menaquinone biosynthesis C-methylase UbiE